MYVPPTSADPQLLLRMRVKVSEAKVDTLPGVGVGVLVAALVGVGVLVGGTGVLVAAVVGVGVFVGVGFELPMLVTRKSSKEKTTGRLVAPDEIKLRSPTSPAA